MEVLSLILAGILNENFAGLLQKKECSFTGF